MGLAERLSGAHILLTGSTGFVGEAFLERVMSDLPDTRITLIIRGSKGQGAQERGEFLLTKAAFKPLSDRLGAEELMATFKRRVNVIEAELGQPLPTLPHDIDVLVHCAGEVSFDPPIDEGFRTNLLGTQGLLEAVKATGVTPHVLHVSTAYVAGLRSGWVLEETHPHTVDWRAEAESSTHQRAIAENASREPVVLEELLKEAAKAAGGAGPQALAQEAERLRIRWVRKRLVEAGRLRARTLGWADCYTFTKALTERMVEEFCADWGVPLSIYRPTIIESALEKPAPGWIEGFKMAEPIIISYGRGDLQDFPASPDAAIDVIPVDIVVASMVAIAASPPPVGRPKYYHVGSSARNPLRFEYLYGTVHEYFTANPLPKRDRGTHKVPYWPFSPAHEIERKLALGEKAIKVADKAVGWIPPSGLARRAATKIDSYSGQLRSLRRLSDLYEAYTQAELYYSDTNTLALFQSLDDEDQKLWAFDSAAIDWHHYMIDLHYPAVTGLLRFAELMPAKPKPVRREIHGHTGNGQVIAAFDMDGTLLASTVVEAYLWTKLADTPNRALAQLREVADLAGDLPSLLFAERRSRAGVIRAIGKRYEGADPAALASLVDQDVASAVLERLSPAAVRTVREHRREGHRTILITGGLEVLTRPLGPLFDEIEAVNLAVDEAGLATGRLAKPPVVGEARAAWLRRRAVDAGWDLAASFAYADSHSDLPMLQAVGHPVLVNPDVVMQRLAKRSKWPILDWKMTPGTPRLPLAQLAGKASPMKALEIYRSVPRYLAARSLAARVPALAGIAPLRLTDRSAPTKPTPEWVRLRPILSGICGSDLATVGGHSSLYFSPLVSMPFTPGHEIVAELLEDVETVFDGTLPQGSRVVLDPQLPCAARGVEPCAACNDGQPSRCDQVTLGHVSPGLQTGYCKDTGGGWSAELVAHPSQLHAVPDTLSDERAVLIEPLACAVRVAERAAPKTSDTVVIIGAGAVGLLTLLALRGQGFDGRITIVAKYPKQAALAHELGATAVVGPAEITRSVRRNSHAVVLKPERGASFLMGGADIVIECAGSSSGLDSALRITRAGGRIVLAGLPAGGVDLTPLWFRELSLEGAYSGGPSAFRTALTLAGDPRLAALPTSFHPLRHYREALEEAGSAGRLGVGKVGFDLRDLYTNTPALRSVT